MFSNSWSCGAGWFSTTLCHFRDDVREAAPSASYVRELRQEMVIMKGQLNELKQMMRVSFDLQLDIQRSVRQEVAAALACLSQPSGIGGRSDMPSAQGACPIPTLGMLMYMLRDK